ncbi:MAG: adenosine-specific kinase [Candidatus Acidifodinimicrobium sp.]
MENKGIFEVKIKVHEGENIIIGQSHFIKTVEDLYECLASSSPHLKFGIAFNEASGDRLVRYEGNDDSLIKESVDISSKIGAGHIFVILLKDGYPINVLNRIKEVEEVVGLYAATSNPITVVGYDDGENGRGILGVIDGKKPLGAEDDNARKKRHKFLRDIGYKR